MKFSLPPPGVASPSVCRDLLAACNLVQHRRKMPPESPQLPTCTSVLGFAHLGNSDFCFLHLPPLSCVYLFDSPKYSCATHPPGTGGFQLQSACLCHHKVAAPVKFRLAEGTAASQPLSVCLLRHTLHALLPECLMIGNRAPRRETDPYETHRLPFSHEVYTKPNVSIIYLKIVLLPVV